LLNDCEEIRFMATYVTREDLAAPATLAAYGYDAEEAQSIFDNALPVQGYTELRAYTGRAAGVRITGAGVAGTFQRDASDTTSADNGGTVIVDATGRRWKRIFDGAVVVEWFGAIHGCDSTVEIQNALNFARSAGIPEVLLVRDYLITNIEVPEGVTLKGYGNRSTYQSGTSGLPSRVTKKAGSTGWGVKLVGTRARIEGVGIYSEAGASGGGLWIAANYCSFIRIASNGHNGKGIHVGALAGDRYINCNGWYGAEITASFNSDVGFSVDDQFTAWPLNDVNAGMLIQAEFRSNGSHGVYVGNCFANVFQSVLTDHNTGYGAYFDAKSAKCTLIGSDLDESNTLGPLFIHAQAQYHTVIGVPALYTNNSPSSNVMSWTRNVFNQTDVATRLAVRRGGDAGIGTAIVVSSRSNRLTNRGVSIDMETPINEGGDPQTGVRLIAKAGPNIVYDRFELQVRESMMVTAFTVDPSSGVHALYPGADNTWNLGITSFRWKDFYMGGTFSHTGASAGFFGATPVTRPTVSGSRSGNAALDSLVTALTNLGLINNGTTA
jgi:hypothetical protein